MAVYACSDLHGNWELWLEIKKFLKPDDTLYYLGDATDRGPNGWAILKEMLNDERIYYIAGNHDIMLADRIGRPRDYHVANLHHSNGGFYTWEDAKNDPDAEKIKNQIRCLPLYAEYENADGLKIFMSHSGSTHIDSREDLIWDRYEYASGSVPAEYDVVVHGHTTIPHLINDLKSINHFLEKEKFETDWEGGALWYCNNRCDIDCCTIVTRQTVLLNLDTFDEEIFEL